MGWSTDTALRRHVRDFRSRMSRSFPPNLARLMLLACAALWGGSYLVAKIAMETIPPMWLMFIRLGGACLVMLALFHRSILPSLRRSIVVPALVVGGTYFGSMALQTTGLQTIDPGRSSFLTAAYAVLTPFAVWLVTRMAPKAIHVVSAIICMTGVGFVALKPSTATLQLSYGDVLTLINAVFVAFNIVYLGIYIKRFNPLAMTFVQFVVAAVLFLASALAFEPGPNAAWMDSEVVWSILYLLLAATTLAQIMQNIGLAHVPTSSASIIMCSESVFSVSFSAIFWGERVGWTSLVGFALIFAAMVLSSMGGRTPVGYHRRHDMTSIHGDSEDVQLL
ncbi:DMT family transporter [uncultured Bifidobacterium sp.]|uniref:DMT family transporter n=1 Tax=uncultured Bifidobacterium sp. TaxID=165187 RepID=UPI00260AB85A|nr:DMT family transporter [uncultured Bifidobacterium sp.]